MPASDWSIFRCAIERMSSPRVWLPAGRSVSSSSKKTTRFLPRAFAVIIAASAQATSSRGLAACSGPCAIPIETAILPARPSSTRSRRSASLVASAIVRSWRLPGTITANSSPPIRQTTSAARTLARRWSARSASTSSPTACPKTSLTFLKSSMSTITTRDVRVLCRGQRQLAAEALVEVAVVVEPGERVGLRLALEPRADVRVVECQRSRVAEPLRELELGVAEGRVLADPVDVERALEDAAGDQRHADQRLRIDRRSRARRRRADRDAPGSRAPAGGARPPSP